MTQYSDFFTNVVEAQFWVVASPLEVPVEHFADVWVLHVHLAQRDVNKTLWRYVVDDPRAEEVAVCRNFP